MEENRIEQFILLLSLLLTFFLIVWKFSGTYLNNNKAEILKEKKKSYMS